jgi:hypothetical protein
MYYFNDRSFAVPPAEPRPARRAAWVETSRISSAATGASDRIETADAPVKGDRRGRQYFDPLLARGLSLAVVIAALLIDIR